jgi:DNA-directed RNA polymerase subunit L
MENIDINVKLHSYRQHDAIKRGKLELLCSGKDLNEQFINGLGRIAVKRIPTYAFAKDLIKIDRINPETGYHDSVPFNHDMMRLRLENIPVMNVDPGIPFLHERFWQNVDYKSADRELHEHEKNNRIEAYIDAKNTNSEGSDIIVHVTTNDMRLTINGVIKKLYDENYPLLLISLKPKEAFRCSMKGALGIGINHTCWDACSNFCYDQETIPDMTIVKFVSASRFDEFTLVDRSLEYYKLRTKILKDEINRMYLLEQNPLLEFKITIKDEDHTMGEAINYELQSHPDIAKSSNTKKDHLIREIEIDVVAFEKDKLLNAIMESMDKLIAKIEKFQHEFNKIRGNDRTDDQINEGDEIITEDKLKDKKNVAKNITKKSKGKSKKE